MQSKISPALSIYLDAIRFLAAITVVLYHSWKHFYPESAFKWPGHEAVVVFFVLSGFVIAHASSRPGLSWQEYLQHRCARILPVTYAAVLVTVALMMLLLPPAAGTNGMWTAALANMTFMAQSAHVSLNLLYNNALWSLNYEVWYYVIFGLWVFAPRRHRLLLAAVAALVAGPKILLLFPIWLMGVWLYRNMPGMPRWFAWALAIVSAAVIAYTTSIELSSTIRSELYRVFPPAWRLHFSTQFIYDTMLGLVVAANFAAVATLCEGVQVNARLGALIRYLSSFTFSIYVFHSPLSALREPLGLTTPLAFYGCLALGIYVLGELTERRSNQFRALFARLFAPRALQAA